jgi:hypothetical protein
MAPLHDVCIKASAQAIWDAITSAEWTAKDGYRGSVESGRFRAVRLSLLAYSLGVG